MTDEKCLSLVSKYRIFLANKGVWNLIADFDLCFPDRQTALNHLYSMLYEMENFIKDGRKDKFFRWLGFMQGVMWSFGCYSLNDLRSHNKTGTVKQ